MTATQRAKSLNDLISRWVDTGLSKPGKTNVGLAKALDLAQPRISEIRKNDRRVLATELRVIAEYIDEAIPAELLPPGYLPQEVPIVSWVSAGTLEHPDAVEAIGVVRTSGLDQRGNWIALRVEGDSMDRISPPGSIIFVDLNDRRLIPNACYVVADGDEGTTYKRFRPSPDRLEPVSTNPSHQPIYYENAPRVIGRVKRSLIDM